MLKKHAHFPFASLSLSLFMGLSSIPPPPPPLALLSTLSLCRMGFRQASSYQATGYVLIGSVSASRSFPGSCAGLTAVMYCWLLIAWSRGGSASSHYSIFGLNFCIGCRLVR